MAGNAEFIHLHYFDKEPADVRVHKGLGEFVESYYVGGARDPETEDLDQKDIAAVLYDPNIKKLLRRKVLGAASSEPQAYVMEKQYPTIAMQLQYRGRVPERFEGVVMMREPGVVMTMFTAEYDKEDGSLNKVLIAHGAESKKTTMLARPFVCIDFKKQNVSFFALADNWKSWLKERGYAPDESPAGYATIVVPMYPDAPDSRFRNYSFVFEQPAEGYTSVAFRLHQMDEDTGMPLWKVTLPYSIPTTLETGYEDGSWQYLEDVLLDETGFAWLDAPFVHEAQAIIFPRTPVSK